MNILNVADIVDADRVPDLKPSVRILFDIVTGGQLSWEPETRNEIIHLLGGKVGLRQVAETAQWKTRDILRYAEQRIDELVASIEKECGSQ